MSRTLKAGLVIVGAVGLSTIGIQATDIARNIDGGLAGLAIESTGPCGEHATLLQFGGHGICMDTYEASPDDSCPHTDPQNEIHTRENLEAGSCGATSQPDVTPWRYVTLTQAQQFCARAGKRLATNDEWYKAAAGMGDIADCAIQTRSASPEGTGESGCVTESGIHDMVGNVWEWVEGEVADGAFDGRELPEEGYVAMVDASGVVAETSEEPQPDFGADYAWTNDDGLRGMIRGGFYGSGSDAGIFALNAAVPLDFRTAGVGFRCVTDI